MSLCLQSQGMASLYEAHDGVRPYTVGKESSPFKSHPLRPICSRMHKNHRDGYMDRWAWMMVRIYAPALGALALLLMLPLGMLRESPMLAGVYAMARWLPALAIAVSVIFGLIATVRLWRWDQGSSPLVCECGGLLGRARDGRYGRYRKCQACSRNVSFRSAIRSSGSY